MNLYIKRLAMVAAALVVTAVLSNPDVFQADEWNLKTIISVKQPFQVPGAVLEPNTKYVLRRLDGNAGTNHVVRIMDADEKKVLTTFMAISDWRLEPTDETVLTFIETAPGYPKPVKSWFYPGRLNGLEFLYSKEEKAEIAAHAPGAQPAQTQTALLEETETFTPPEQEAVTMPAPVEEQIQVDREKPSDVAPTEAAPEESVAPEEPAPVESAQPEEAPASTATETLPATGSEFPLLALLGISCLGLGRALRRR
jgi:hypothetical protein